MLKRHEDTLTRRIEEVVWEGYAFIEEWELRSWYEKARINKIIWRDLLDRFDALAEDETAKLYVYESSHGYMLIHSDGLSRVTSKKGLEPLHPRSDEVNGKDVEAQVEGDSEE